MYISIIFTLYLFNKKNKIIDENNRGLNLDVYRGVLCFFVVFGHSVLFSNYEINREWWPADPSLESINIYAAYGVDSFFMLTGYLFANYFSVVSFNVKKFYIKRFIRIYSGYILCIILISIFVYIENNFFNFDVLKLLVFDGKNIDIKISKFYAPLYFHFWSLKIELIFYSILPFVYCIEKYGLKGKILNFAVFILLIYFIDYHFIFILMGIIIKKLNIKVNVNFYKTSLLIIFYIIISEYHNILNKYVFLISKICLYGCTLIIFSSVSEEIFKDKKYLYPFSLLGKISYSVYLTQGLALVCGYILVSSQKLNLTGVEYLVVSMPFVFGFSLINYRFGEFYYFKIYNKK
jgi:peptidoglycan/LPS O-acetylase OafA/YrhL